MITRDIAIEYIEIYIEIYIDIAIEYLRIESRFLSKGSVEIPGLKPSLNIGFD